MTAAYSLDRKRITLAYLTEGIIALASLFSALWFGITYGHDWWQASVMMLPALPCAIAEFGRVPLAISLRTDRSWLVRGAALLGVLALGCITVKSMSQLSEMMFRPRLFDVIHAEEQLRQTQEAQVTVSGRIAAADHMVADRRASLLAAEERLKSDVANMGNLPKDQCHPTSGTTKDGRPWQSMACKPDSRVGLLATNLKLTVTARDDAAHRLDEAMADRRGLDLGDVDRAVAAASVAHREAVMHSQLHSFAGMVFGVAPTAITEQQIHNVMRLFVFIPAICVALASSLLAFSAVTKPANARLMARLAVFVSDVHKLRKAIRNPVAAKRQPRRVPSKAARRQPVRLKLVTAS